MIVTVTDSSRLRRTMGAVALAAALAVAGCSSSSDPKSASGANLAPPSISTVKPTPTGHATHTPSAAEIRATVSARVAKIIHSEPAGGVSVAALNTKTGAEFSAGARSGMWTASTYKLLVLVALLRESGDGVSDDSSAAAAIENSDNKAGYSLFLAAGGNPGLASTLQALHTHHTVMGTSDPTFTRTSAADYLKVLETLVRPGLLSKSQRSFVLGLMRNVEADQRWGVGVVADKGTRFANKNGWLSIDDSNGPGETDNGLWAVNSVGIVTVHGQPVLMAIFTEHQSDMARGVALVQTLARTIVPAVSRS